jgi:ribosomal protein S18 acetylase RimI-like enzyme
MTRLPMAADLAVRPVVEHDAEDIARIFLESAAHHAGLDPDRYTVRDAAVIAERYRHGRQHPQEPGSVAVTLVAECSGALVGFVDARLETSHDPMHRDITYCHISEIAVGSDHRSQGVGAHLLRVAEAWGARQGATYASLEHHVLNARAAAFYERRMGYAAAAVILIKRL